MEEIVGTARPGRIAPEFKAQAYFKGGFTEVKLGLQGAVGDGVLLPRGLYLCLSDRSGSSCCQAC